MRDLGGCIVCVFVCVCSVCCRWALDKICSFIIQLKIAEVISEKADINKTKRPMDKQSRVETHEKKGDQKI